MAANQRWRCTVGTRGWRETPWHTARVAHELGGLADVEDADSGRWSPQQSSARLAPLLRRVSRLPLVIAGAFLDLLGLAALAAYVVLALFGVFALAGLGHAHPAFPGDQTASLRVLLIPASAALVALLEPLRALLQGAG